MTPSPPDDPAFDAYAARYDEALQRGLSVSGEDKDFFAAGRVEWLGRCLARAGLPEPRSVLDYGCGTGSAAPHLHARFRLERLVGVDVSARSVELAAAAFPDPRNRFATPETLPPDGTLDLAFCNGVFHHIPPAERPAAARYVLDTLKPGGVFAFWENNPWNPGTRLVMRRIPFDRDAVLVWPSGARALLRAAGFEVLSTTARFVFPACLRLLRGLEDALAPLPAGAQYQVLCRKPGASPVRA